MRTRLVNIPGFANNYTVAASLAYLAGFEREMKCCEITHKPHTPHEREVIQVYRAKNFSSEPDISVENLANGRFIVNYNGNIDERVFGKVEKGLRFRYLLGIFGIPFDAWFVGLKMFRKFGVMTR